jgi:hypothetical protein
MRLHFSLFSSHSRYSSEANSDSQSLHISLRKPASEKDSFSSKGFSDCPFSDSSQVRLRNIAYCVPHIDRFFLSFHSSGIAFSSSNQCKNVSCFPSKCHFGLSVKPQNLRNEVAVLIWSVTQTFEHFFACFGFSSPKNVKVLN